MTVTRTAVLVGSLLWFPALPGAQALAQTPITLDQAIADEDWIGSPVTTAWWSADRGRVFYQQRVPGGCCSSAACAGQWSRARSMC